MLNGGTDLRTAELLCAVHLKKRQKESHSKDLFGGIGKPFLKLKINQNTHKQ
jgi:hypothetical protein